MCGRYSFHDDRHIPDDWIRDEHEFAKSYNAAPGQHHPIIVRNETMMVENGFWGFVPFWEQSIKGGHKIINARAETVDTKSSFKQSLMKRRCLIPANGFYEWKHEGERKTPYYIHLKDKPMFYFAGIYEEHEDEQGNSVKTYAIITTEPNSLMEKIHNRMPVILEDDEIDTWLNPHEDDVAALSALLDPYPASKMAAYPVSDLVNSPRSNSPKLIEETNKKEPN